MGWTPPKLGDQDKARVDELNERSRAASDRNDPAGVRDAQNEIIRIREAAGQVDREN